MTLHVVAGLAYHEGLVLLGKRKEGGKRGGLWEMPGGKVDGFEHPEEALAREWREELGLDIIVRDYIAQCHLSLEVDFKVELYAVTFSLNDLPAPLVHDDLMWSRLDHAIEYLPCSPALYLHYPRVRTWLATRPRM